MSAHVPHRGTPSLSLCAWHPSSPVAAPSRCTHLRHHAVRQVPHGGPHQPLARHLARQLFRVAGHVRQAVERGSAQVGRRGGAADQLRQRRQRLGPVPGGQPGQGLIVTEPRVVLWLQEEVEAAPFVWARRDTWSRGVRRSAAREVWIAGVCVAGTAGCARRAVVSCPAVRCRTHLMTAPAISGP